jgi:WD40 repeat protein
MRELKMMALFKKTWTIFTWIAFTIGVVGCVLMLWSKLWPSLNMRFPQNPTATGQSGNPVVRRPETRIHPEFIQNLNNQMSNSTSSDSISSMAYDPKSDFLLVGRESGAIDIWDGKQANARREIKAHKMRASQLSFSSDGRVFFSNSYFEDVTHVWDAASGSLVHTIERSRGPVVETSDPNLFVVASSSGLRIFDLAAKEVLPDTYRQVGDVVTALAYDVPTDQLAIGTASGGVELWRLLKVPVPTLERIAAAKPYATGNWVKAVQFFDSGRVVYSLPQRGNLDEWSVPRLEPLRSREISLGFVASSVFIPEKGGLAMVGFRKGDNDAYSNFLGTFNLNDGSESLVDLKASGSGSIVYLPSLSTIIASKGLTISTIDIAKAR